MEAFKWLLENYQVLISAIVGLLGAALAVSVIIPGEQPDKFLQWLVDLVSKISRK